MGEGYLTRRGGSGGGLNLKVVGGTSRPGGSDTLYWDGNTEGKATLEHPEMIGCFTKISDAIPVLSDCKNGMIVQTSDGAETTCSAEEIDRFYNGTGIVGFAGSQFGIYIIPSDGFVMPGAFTFPESGVWVPYAEDAPYVTSITIPGYTGFGGGSVKNNTIWVNTETDINGYAFSADEPASPVEGMVWIKTATESATPINVDKKNTVLIYPQTAQQYVGGAWVGKTAKVYTDGTWHELWDGYYYKLGETYEAITGGYSAGTSLAKVTFNSNNMVITQASGTSAGNVVATVETVDVTDVNTLVFDCLADSTDACSVGVGSVRDNWNNYIATAKVNNTARALVTLDVSSITGEVYILLKAWFNSAISKGKLTVYNIYKQ